MDLSGLTAVITAAEMKAWLSANCLSPINPVMTGTDLGIIMQKITDVMEPGIPAGGTVGQLLSKIDGADYNSHWIDPNYVPLAGGVMTGLLTLSGDPTAPMHAATKNYVDNYIAGLQFIDVAAKAASPKGANISISSAPASLDGVTGVAGDRWLLKDQTNGAENGVYVFNGAGSALTRAADASTGSQLANKTIPVSQGTTQADTWWTVTNDSITIGTTALTILQTAGAGTYAAGAGLTLTGNLFSLTNSTISGIPLGSNLANLSVGQHLSMSTAPYNGSVAQAIFVDATTSATANVIAARDGNANLSVNNVLNGITALVLNTNTLTTGSSYLQVYYGNGGTLTLPVASLLAAGQSWQIINNGTGSLTVQTSGSNTMQVMAIGTKLIVTCIDGTRGTGTASWYWSYSDQSTGGLAAAYVPYTGATGAVNLGNNTLQSGSLGVGVLPQSNRVLFSQKNATGNINQLGADIQLTAQSDVTTAMYGYRSLLSTAAAAFTLSNIYNFFAEGVSKGAGSTVSQQYGFYVQSDFNAAAGNIGFYGGVPASGTSNYNLYMGGTAPNYLAGVLGIGVSPSLNTAINIGNTLSGSTSAYGVLNAPILSSGTTGTYQAFRSAPITAAAAFTLPQVIHYYSLGVSLGSGSAVTSQFGFFAENNLTAATNNYGFYGGIPIGANNNYNLYMGGTAMNFLQGNLGIGTLPITNAGLTIAGTMTSSTGAYGVDSRPVISSTMTASSCGFRSWPTTVAASFNMTNMIHYYAVGIGLGAGSSVTAQYGFYADSSLTGAGANYGFYGNVPNNTGSYNLYMAGAGMNYLAGNLAIGTLPVSNVGVLVQRSLSTGNTGVSVQDTIQSAVTAVYNSYRTIMVTQAAAFTLNNAFHYIAQQGTLGAGSSIINQMGFIADSTITGATNNYGFYGNIAAGTGRWNLFMAGTADNFINGKLGIGTTSLSAKLNIGAATTAQASLNIASGVLLATPVSGAIEYDGTNLYYTNSTATRHTLAVSDSPVFTGTVSMPHLKGSSGTPTISAGSGAGTGATVSVAGNDVAGVIHVTTGSSPVAGGTIATITYNTPYSSTPIPLVVSDGSVNGSFFIGTRNSSGFSLINLNTVLSASMVYEFAYHVIGV